MLQERQENSRQPVETRNTFLVSSCCILKQRVFDFLRREYEFIHDLPRPSAGRREAVGWYEVLSTTYQNPRFNNVIWIFHCCEILKFDKTLRSLFVVSHLNFKKTHWNRDERDPSLQHRQADEIKIASDNTLRTDKMSFHHTRAVTRVSWKKKETRMALF
jgi:hypothetical protein